MAKRKDIVFIIDKSGSMTRLTEETVRGFNDTVQDSILKEEHARVSLYLFNHRREKVLDRVPASTVPELTDENYTPQGRTALIDAVFDTVNEFDLLKAYGEHDVPDDVLFIITTDGLENASRDHTLDALKILIENVQVKFGWQFIFLGADLDAVKQAESMGIDRKYAARYSNTSEGTISKYGAMKKAVEHYYAAKLDNEDWKSGLEKDR